MDLSFPRFEHDASLTILPSDLAVMMVGVAARQAASPTALSQARLPSLEVAALRLSPTHGAFNDQVAASLARWRVREDHINRTALAGVQTHGIMPVSYKNERLNMNGGPRPDPRLK